MGACSAPPPKAAQRTSSLVINGLIVTVVVGLRQGDMFHVFVYAVGLQAWAVFRSWVGPFVVCVCVCVCFCVCVCARRIGAMPRVCRRRKDSAAKRFLLLELREKAHGLGVKPFEKSRHAARVGGSVQWAEKNGPSA